MNYKKKLKQQYKEMKPSMGVFIIKNNVNGKAFLGVSNDTKSIINRHRFQLQWGGHPIKELQQDWEKYGEDAFTIEVLEYLEYDKKEEKVDYSEELEILKIMWIDKLNEDDKLQLYN